ncbi:hypothetical protein [Streptomyces sp. NPDC058657]|uniref:hypothetical protein n=1 Tax=unclassified Streptomyces TaxID=2593676 RepID=UPI0036504A17
MTDNLQKPPGSWTECGGDEVDWAGERKWTDAPWLIYVWVGAAFFLILAGWWIFFGRETALWAGAASAVAMAGCLGFGARARRKLVAETGVPSHRLPVLVRRIRDERLPGDPRHRRAMAVLARQQVTYTMPVWMYFLAPGAFLLNAVTQAVDGDWWAAALCCVAVGFFTAIAFTARRNGDRAARVLGLIEGTAGPTAPADS